MVPRQVDQPYLHRLASTSALYSPMPLFFDEVTLQLVTELAYKYCQKFWGFGV